MIDLANWFKCTIIQVYVWAFSIHSIVAKNTSNLILELCTVHVTLNIVMETLK